RVLLEELNVSTTNAFMLPNTAWNGGLFSRYIPSGLSGRMRCLDECGLTSTVGLSDASRAFATHPHEPAAAAEFLRQTSAQLWFPRSAPLPEYRFSRDRNGRRRRRELP